MVSKTVLPNGLRVVTEEIPHVRSVSLGVLIRAGSRYETPEINGISHCLEHMLFKGTSRRTAREIAETIDAAGGQLNAYTSKEYTCFYARVLDEHMIMAGELLGEMLLDSLLDVKELEKEKGVIREEIRMVEDSPDELIHDLLSQAVLADHPLGQRILGSHESVQELTREELQRYMDLYYHPGNMVVAAAGNLKHEAVVELVMRSLSPQRPSRSHSDPIYPVAAPGEIVLGRETEQVHLCLGFPGVTRDDERKYALYILDSILGGGMSSRLFQDLRENRGLVYSAYSYHSAYQDTGLFSLYAGTSPHRVEEVVGLLHKHLQDLQQNLIDPGELHRAKEQFKGGMVLTLESTANRMSRLGKSELFYGRIVDTDEILQAVEAVTREQIQEVAQELFDPQRLGMAVIGPTQIQENWPRPVEVD